MQLMYRGEHMNKKNSDSFKNSGLGQWLYTYAGQLVFLLVLVLILGVTTESFFKPLNLLNVSRQISNNMIIACAMTMILISGGIDLSTGSVMAISGMTAAYLSERGLPFGVTLFAALAVGALAGVINGLILANTNLPPFIVTYSMQSILRGMVYVITGAATMRITDKHFLEFGGGSIGRFPYPVIYMLIVILIVGLLLGRSRMGRHIYAIGGNIKAAQFAGINIKSIKILIYTISGVCAALAGLIATSRNSSMQPALGTGTEMDAIAAVVLGGTSMAGGQGGISGTIIGAMIIGIINNGLNLLGMDSFYQYIAKGIVILCAVYTDDVKNKQKIKGIVKKVEKE